MSSDMRMKLNSEWPWREQHSTKENNFYQQIGLKWEEETIEMLHWEHIYGTKT
jgi:hypothetical protein